MPHAVDTTKNTTYPQSPWPRPVHDQVGAEGTHEYEAASTEARKHTREQDKRFHVAGTGPHKL